MQNNATRFILLLISTAPYRFSKVLKCYKRLRTGLPNLLQMVAGVRTFCYGLLQVSPKVCPFCCPVRTGLQIVFNCFL